VTGFASSTIVSTEKLCVQWIKRFILFHGKHHLFDMDAAEIGRYPKAVPDCLLADMFYGLIINQAPPKSTGWFQLSSSALSAVKGLHEAARQIELFGWVVKGVNPHGEHSGIAGDVDCPQHRIAQQYRVVPTNTIETTD